MRKYIFLSIFLFCHIVVNAQTEIFYDYYKANCSSLIGHTNNSINLYNSTYSLIVSKHEGSAIEYSGNFIKVNTKIILLKYKYLSQESFEIEEQRNYFNYFRIKVLFIEKDALFSRTAKYFNRGIVYVSKIPEIDHLAKKGKRNCVLHLWKQLDN